MQLSQTRERDVVTHRGSCRSTRCVTCAPRPAGQKLFKGLARALTPPFPFPFFLLSFFALSRAWLLLGSMKHPAHCLPEIKVFLQLLSLVLLLSD